MWRADTGSVPVRLWTLGDILTVMHPRSPRRGHNSLQITLLLLSLQKCMRCRYRMRSAWECTVGELSMSLGISAAVEQVGVSHVITLFILLCSTFVLPGFFHPCFS